MDSYEDFTPQDRHDDLPGDPAAFSQPVERDQRHRTPKQRRDQSERGFFSRLFWFFTAVLLVLIAWQIAPNLIEQYEYAASKGRIRAEYENAVQILKDDPLENVSNAYELVAQKVRPSVVSIRTIVIGAQTNQGQRRIAEARGQGSGVIMSSSGHIITNAHVLEGASEIQVILHDRRMYQAKLVGEVDQLNDLAVLKIEASSLIPAEWGDSDELHVGSIVWAIGSPFGYDQSVTSGIVSAKNRVAQGDRLRQINSHQQLLQTDAAVNPGNSGGPLVDSKGRVVGINTAIHGEKFQGISFAVPSSIAKFVYEQMIEKGHVDFGILGVVPLPVFQADADRLRLPDIDGALISEVRSATPAYAAGLKVDDVIRRWNGEPVRDHGSVFRLVDMTPPDSTITLGVMRNGVEQNVDVKIGSRRQFERALRRRPNF